MDGVRNAAFLAASAYAACENGVVVSTSCGAYRFTAFAMRIFLPNSLPFLLASEAGEGARSADSLRISALHTALPSFPDRSPAPYLLSSSTTAL